MCIARLLTQSTLGIIFLAMANKRKIGSRKIDLSDESTATVLKKAKPLARTDWGGQEADDVILKKAIEENLDLGPKTRAFVKKIAEEQAEGIRKRIYPRMDEAINRLEKPIPDESSP
jgi:hypothetical protein